MTNNKEELKELDLLTRIKEARPDIENIETHYNTISREKLDITAGVISLFERYFTAILSAGALKRTSW